MKYQEFSNKIDLFNYLNSGIDKYGNLFKKRVGIQLWTDELYNRFLLEDERLKEGIKE